MNRRGFLQMLGLGVAGIALEQAIPFNRVWSFPKNIVISNRMPDKFLSTIYYDDRMIAMLKANTPVQFLTDVRHLPVATFKTVKFLHDFTADLD